MRSLVVVGSILVAASVAGAAVAPRVVVVPGALGGDAVYRPMRAGLARRGLAPVKSGIHLNVGSLARKVERVKAAALRAHAESQAPVQLAGHSLGGAIAAIAADELAVEHPEIFEGLGDRPHVATLGAPLDMTHRQDGASKIVTWLAPKIFPDFSVGEDKLRALDGARRIRVAAGYAVHDKIMYPSGATLPWARRVAIPRGGHFRLLFRADTLAELLR